MDEIQKQMVPGVIYSTSILKTSVLLYSIVRSACYYDDSHSTEEPLDCVEDCECLEGVHVSHYLYSFRVNNVTLSKEIVY
jgi:hypothetical protein